MDEEISTAAEVAEGAALRFGRAVHSDPDAATTPEQEPLPVGVQKKPVEEKSPAEWAYERIILYIQNFEKTLDNQHEVANYQVICTLSVQFYEPGQLRPLLTPPDFGRELEPRHLVSE